MERLFISGTPQNAARMAGEVLTAQVTGGSVRDLIEAHRGTPDFAAMRGEYLAGVDSVEAAREAAMTAWDGVRGATHEGPAPLATPDQLPPVPGEQPF
jgi:hypothetical protein